MARLAITALIDTYNYGRFIEQTIESVLLQECLADVEVIVVDDGSTDDTEDRVAKYGSKVAYFRKLNGGQASAFNYGFARSRGDIIAFLDADDYWLPGKLNRVFEAFSSNDSAGLVYHPRMEFNSLTGKTTEGDFSACSGDLRRDPSALLNYRVHPTSSLSFSRRFLEKVLPMPETIRLQADTYLAILVVFLAPVVALTEPLSVYRLHGKNLHAQGDPDRTIEQSQDHLNMRRFIFDKAKEWLGQNGYDLKQPEVVAFFDQLDLFLETDQFRLKAPGRVAYSRHLLKQCATYWEYTGWSLRALNIWNAMAAGVLGYHGFPDFYKRQNQLLQKLKRT